MNIVPLDANRSDIRLHAQFIAALAQSSIADVTCFADMSGNPFEAERSGNLVVTAKRR